MTPEALSEIHVAAFQAARGWSAAEFASLLQSNGMILCGDARSFILGRVVLDEAEVLTIATAPVFQRQGFASRALTAFADRAKDAGAASLFLEVAADNTPAKQLYFNHNFEIIAQRKGYYASISGPAIDALIMRKPLK
jgi:ribosomal-protein-alanine N-acetyltransferase